MGINGILLDIEGTVGPISFVHNVLFPYSQLKLPEYLQKNPLELELLQEILVENEKDFTAGNFPKILNSTNFAEVNEYLQYLIREDRKFGPLKHIQGKIWKEGFEQGELRSELFEDVPLFLQKTVQCGYKIFIYSSGSEEAQRLFFKYSVYGDLTEYISEYFDTTVGPKQVSESYINIARKIDIPPSQIVFFTDVVAEADAAAQAGIGLQIVVERPGNKLQPAHTHPTLENLLSFFQ